MLKLFIGIVFSTALTAAQMVLPGEREKIDLDNELLAQALAEVEPQINRALSSIYYHKIGSLLKADAQIIDGMLFTATFHLSVTVCLKTATQILESCQLNNAAPVQTCHASILSEPWDTHTAQLVNFNCDAEGFTSVEQLNVEGTFPVDTEDEQLKGALLSAEHAISELYKSLYVSQVGKVLKASARVVDGLRYFITFKLGQTYHLKNEKHTKFDMQNKDVRNLVTCHVILWVKPIAESAKILDFKCDN